MRRRPIAGVLLALSLSASGLGGAVPARAGTATLYALTAQSQFEQGCFPPCECPALLVGLGGSFRLTPVERDPVDPFRLFKVSEVNWRVKLGGTSVPVTGSGTYRVGGEFALMHQLALDLAIGDAPPQHFDSGLVVGGGEFPAIDIRISTHGEVCFDTVFHVVAKPLPGCG